MFYPLRISRGIVRFPLVPSGLALLALALGSAGRANADGESAWLSISEPAEAAQIDTGLALVPVQGSTGTGAEIGHDVLIALDRSVSVWDPSGRDLDGDGRIGRARGDLDLFVDYQQKCTDPDDTILAAELRAAQALIDRFDPNTTRVGLLSFGNGAKVHAPIGSSRARLQRALAAVPHTAEFGGTSFENAFKLALLQFQGLPPSAAGARSRSVILLSDGRPTQPAPVDLARRFAVLAARELGREGVRIFAFALRPQSAEDAVYNQITRVTGGAYFLAGSPADVIDFAPSVQLTRIARIQIDNLSANKPGRAVRLLPDGSFDGFAPLVPGLNILRVQAISEGGDVHAVDRRVYFNPLETSSPEETARMQAILRTLQLRTMQAQMSDAVQRRLRQSQKRIEIGVSN